MKATIFNRPMGKALAVWCAFATASSAALGGTAVLPNAELISASGVTSVEPYNMTVEDTTVTGWHYKHYNEGIINGSGNAVLDWGKLNIGTGETLTFSGGGSFYNVVSSSGGQSMLMGILNGKDGSNVYIFNPNGIVIGGGAKIDVGGIFGAYAMGVDPTTLKNYLDGTSSSAISASGDKVGQVVVENGAQIQAAAIQLAGEGIKLSGIEVSDTNPTFTGPTTLISGGELAIDSISGGSVTVKLGDNASTGLAGVDLMGSFTAALTVKAADKVNVGGKTVAGGAVSINGGLINVANALESTSGSVTLVSGNDGDITIGANVTGNGVTVSAAGNVAINAKLESTGVDKDVTLVSKKKIFSSTDGSIVSGRNVSMITIGTGTDDGIALEGVVKAENKLTATVLGGDIKIDNQNNAVKGDVKLSAAKGTATFYNSVDTKLAAVTAKEAIITSARDVDVNGEVKATDGAAIVKGKGVNVNADGSVSATGDATLKATTQDITVAGKVTSTNGKVDIDAVTGVAVTGTAVINAKQNLEITTTGGDVTTTENTTLTAGADLVVSAVNQTEEPDGNITIKGKATVAEKTDFDAKKDVVANNAANDFQGAVDATANEGSVTLVDANSIALNDIDAATTVSVTAKNGDIEVLQTGDGIEAGEAITLDASQNITANNKVNAGETEGDITFTAGDSIAANAKIHNDNGDIIFNAKNKVAVNDSVRTEKGDIEGTATDGDITIGEEGTMWASNGNVVLDAGKNIKSVNKETAITAKDTIDLTAGEEIGSPLNVSSPYLKVLSGGSSDIVMKKGEFNPNGDLAVDDDKSSIETGKDLDLVVEGNLSTPKGGVIRVGRDLDVAVNSATPEINLTLGGNYIRATDETQLAMAFKLVGGTKFPEIIGTHTDTAVFVDGRVAGGDSVFFSILQSYEAVAALGATPDIRGSVIEKIPKAYLDQKLHVNDFLPNVWDEKIDDKEVVPQEVTAKEQSSDTVAMR